MTKPANVVEALAAVMDELPGKVVVTDAGCILWQRALNQDGYGIVWNGKRTVRAHRWAYEIMRGPIPHGLVTDHLCRERARINPWHIDIVTQGENARRGGGGAEFGRRARARTHCKHGHAFDERNTYWKPDGKRGCRTCALDRQRLRRALKRSA